MPPTPTKRFSELFAGLDAGRIDEAIGMDLAALVEDVQSRGKAGKLTITVTVEPQGLNNSMAEVTADHKVTSPKPPKAGSILHIGDHGSLHRADPYQQSIDTNA